MKVFKGFLGKWNHVQPLFHFRMEIHTIPSTTTSTGVDKRGISDRIAGSSGHFWACNVTWNSKATSFIARRRSSLLQRIASLWAHTWLDFSWNRNPTVELTCEHGWPAVPCYSSRITKRRIRIWRMCCGRDWAGRWRHTSRGDRSWNLRNKSWSNCRSNWCHRHSFQRFILVVLVVLVLR